MPRLHSSIGRIHLFVLALFTLLSLVLSWPLLPRLATHVPGIAQWAFDESTFIWNIWYFKHALVDNLSSPLHTELVYYPLGIDLLLYTYNFFHALLAQPLYLATNLPLASNTTLLISTVLSGYGAFLLARYLLGHEVTKARGQENKRTNFFWSSSLPVILSSSLAGLLYAFATNRAVYAALGHYDMVTTQWIPFYALMLLRSLDARLTAGTRRKSAALAGLFFAFNGLAEMITAMFLAIFTLIVVVISLTQSRQGAEETGAQLPLSINNQQSTINNLRRVLIAFPIIGLIGLIAWGPVLIPILGQFLADDFSLKDWGEAIPLSTDLWGWLTPTVLHPIFGGDLIARLREVQEIKLIPGNEEMAVGFRDINTVFLGWVSLLLALIGLIVAWRKTRIWLWTALIFGAFTLGPFLQINGQYIYNLDGVKTTFPLPFALLHYIPVVKANRAPNRNSVILMLALAVLLAYGVHWLLKHLHNRRVGQIITAALAVLILFEHLTLPVALSDARIPAVYDEIAADPRPVSVMHLPLGWRNSFGTWGPENTRLQYYMSQHQKPMLGGNISRAPDFKMAYFQRLPYFQLLRDVQVGAAGYPEATMPGQQTITPEQIDVARAEAAELLFLYNVGYVLLMPPIPERYPYVDMWQAAWDFAKATLPLEDEPFWTGDGAEGGTIEAYRVLQREGQDSFALNLGEAGTFAYRAEGWDDAETDMPYDTSAIWATEATSRLLVPLRQVDAGESYQVTVRARPFIAPQSAALRVNGTVLARQELLDDWQELTWEIPAGALVDGLNHVDLLWTQTAVPREVNPGSRAIGSTGVDLPLDADLTGQDGFIALFDEAGEQIDASAGRRGINITVLDRTTGEISSQQGFDVAANEFESAALANFLRSVVDGQIVLAVSKEDGNSFLTQEAVDTLRNLGADLSLDALQGQHFALVGVQGAQPGSAALEVQPERPFLRVSLNQDRRTLAAAVDWVEIGR